MCKNVCLLSRCETRDKGGCYCECRKADYKSRQKSIKEGYTRIINGMAVYSPTKFGELPENPPYATEDDYE